MTIVISDWALAFFVALCGVGCTGAWLLSLALSRRLHESADWSATGLGDLIKPMAGGMLLGLLVMVGNPPDAQAILPSASVPTALLLAVLAGLCAGSWTARPRLGRVPVAQADLVRRLCVAGDTHEDATARVAVRLALAAGYDRVRASDLMAAASLHDIGTSAIPASILNKSGPLEARELALVRSHTRIGHRMLARYHEPMLDLAADIALHHHEQWDGGGYPAGLSGEDIPLTSRVVALAVALDRLLGSDPGHAAASLDQVAGMLRADRGRCFDPRLVALLLADLPAMVAARNGVAARTARDHEPGLKGAWLTPARFRAFSPQRPAW